MLCTEIATLAGGELRQILGNLTEALDPYLTPAALHPLDPLADERDLLRKLPETEIERLSNLYDNDALGLIRNALESLLGKQSDGTLGINRVVDSALKSSGGVLNVSTGDMTLITADSDVISMRINVSWFAVSGLDTFTSFDVLEPISNFTIRNLLAMDRIECQVGVVIELEAGEGELNGIYAAQGMLPQSTAKAPRPSKLNT